jgi:hypothetical protein
LIPAVRFVDIRTFFAAARFCPQTIHAHYRSHEQGFTTRYRAFLLAETGLFTATRHLY